MDGMTSSLFQQQLQSTLGSNLHVDRELHPGGVAHVFVARQDSPPREVVVKVLDPELAQAVDVERFRREIQVAARLEHPCIVPVIEACQSGTLLYYTMPLVRGETLREVFHQRGPLPVDVAIGYAEDIGGAIACAHAHNIIHRDIKPENIFIDGGRALVTDFGIARAIEHAADIASVTSTGLTVGTPRYMSPEQAAAERRIDGRSDIYSLACVLYEMLAGEPPFAGSTPRILLARHMHQDPPCVRVVRKDVPEHVEAALLKAMQKAPAARFATVEEFLAALRAAPLEAPRPRRDARRIVVLGGIVATGVVAASLIAFLLLK
jgi:serine/threonine-protein kinase